jgi:hypothetical protein
MYSAPELDAPDDVLPGLLRVEVLVEVDAVRFAEPKEPKAPGRADDDEEGPLPENE